MTDVRGRGPRLLEGPRLSLAKKVASGHLRVHIVGAGGAGMNAMAIALAEMGHEVTGSDQQASAALRRLDAMGARTFVGHDAANVGGAEVVAFSAAVGAGNVELEEARRRGLPVLSRADLLAAICGIRRTVAVSGSHGKTTTTAMLAAVLEEGGVGPSFLVGGDLPGGRPGAKWTQGEWLVVEADESDGTFLRLPAEAVVVTSVEADHLDHFGTLAALEEAFRTFAAQAPGPKVVCLDDPGAVGVARALAGSQGLATYGTGEGATYGVGQLVLEKAGAHFVVSGPSGDLGSFQLGVPGLHNVLDAAAAIATGAELGLGPDAARRALASYQAVARRFELHGTAGGVTYVDDYAHNPGKVRAALAAARNGGWRRVVAVFQPHRYSRTEALWEELGRELAAADVVFVTGIYGAGEAPRPGVTGRMVAMAAENARSGLLVYYAEDRAELVPLLRRLLEPGDLCLTMGAGDLTTLPEELLKPGPGPESGGP